MKLKVIFTLALILSCYFMFNSKGQTETSPNVQRVVTGNNGFAMDLYGKLRASKGNVFFSPYSISTALAMTYGGARGETAAQMAHTLQFDLPSNELHQAFGQLEENLNAVQKAGHVQLSVANSLWPQKGFDFLPDYLALCKKFYGTSIQSVDFAGDTEAARKQINDWVEDKTRKKIVELLKPGMIGGSTRLVLANAIYFKGDWANQFEARHTKDQPFHISPETDITAPLMQQTSDFGYAEFPDLQVLEVPYAGNELSMVVLLPRQVDGMGDLETNLTAENLSKWTGFLGSQKVQVFFPKFTVTSEFSLADTLSEMGMPDAFIFKTADFSGIDGQKDLYISRVIHKAYVKVDEKGTEAAAATAVTMELGMVARPTQIPVFRADHPFLFLIRDNQTGSILFLGRMTDPTK
jgi:serpin B